MTNVVSKDSQNDLGPDGTMTSEELEMSLRQARAGLSRKKGLLIFSRGIA